MNKNLVSADHLSTLLLRKLDFSVIGIVSAGEAVKKLFTGRFLGLDRHYNSVPLELWLSGEWEPFEDSPCLASAKRAWIVPTIMITSDDFFYSPFDKSLPTTIHNLCVAYNYTCQSCGKSFQRKHLTREHVKPKSKGGGEGWDNVTLTCRKCNNRKSNLENWLTHNGTPLKADPSIQKKLRQQTAGIAQSIKQRPEWSNLIRNND